MSESPNHPHVCSIVPPQILSRMPDLRETRSSNIIPRACEHAPPLETGFAPWMNTRRVGPSW